MKKVIVIGSATVDCLMKSDAFKMLKSHEVAGGVAMCEVLGGKMDAQEGLLCTGGGGTNVAVGLKRLGESVKTIVRLGDDWQAKMVEGDLRAEGVLGDMIQHGKGKTALSAVLVALSGARSIITYRGESAVIAGEEINWLELNKADWIQISSLSGQMNLLEDLVSFATSKRIKVGINPGKGELNERERLIKLLPKFDFISVNRMEAAMLWKESYEDEERLMKRFIESGCRLVTITDGKRGAMIGGSGKIIKMEAFGNKSMDDTGAGDAFVSGAVYGVLNGFDLENILKSGLASGGSVVTKLGAKDGLLRKGEIEKWLKKRLRSVETQL